LTRLWSHFNWLKLDRGELAEGALSAPAVVGALHLIELARDIRSVVLVEGVSDAAAIAAVAARSGQSLQHSQ
jgi:hypothetical protein